jgi:hypothetical protein
MVRAAFLIAMVVVLGCSRATATPTPTPLPTPTPVGGPIPAAVDDAFCELARELEPLSASLAAFGEAVSEEGFSGALVQREAPVLRRAIATVSPYLPTIARWEPTAPFANALISGLGRVDEGVAALERDPNDLVVLALLGIALREVEAIFRDDLPALRIEHPEIACPGATT